MQLRHALAVLLLSLPLAAHAQGTALIVNKWKNTLLDLSSGQAADGSNPAAPGALWVLEPVDASAQFYRLRSATSGGALHIEQGPLMVSAVEPGWWSAMWTVEPVDGQFIRLRNRWKPDAYIHNQNGAPTIGAIQPGWWSAMWQLQGAPAPTIAAAPSAPAGQASLIVQNRSPQPLDIFIDDAAGEPAFVVSLPPGQQLTQPTPVGRRWRFAQKEQWLGAHMASAQAQQLISIPQ